MGAQLDLTTYFHFTMRFRSDKVIGSFLAAAVGDALGWPFEDRSRRVGREYRDQLPSAFIDWTRRAGTRFLSYHEPIAPGTYSDDTQLILATARSLFHKDRWWNFFTEIELPMWSLYERGGGGATKRAVESWTKSTPPWSSADTANRYFEAGGNGVCMRILPHVVTHIDSSDFRRLANDIALNGIATHGHPRALLGALLHGYLLWTAFRQCGTLNYGGLVSVALESVGEWARGPDLPDSWHQTVTERTVGYPALWDITVEEILKLLRIARRGIDSGALATGREILHEIGAFDRRINGAGTVTAVAAIFLASRYAASPLQGLLSAATAHGSDTDTLSSMVGSLLGAISGEEWLGHFGSKVQDATYIRKLASRLHDFGELDAHWAPINKANLERFTSELERLHASEGVILPDGRSAVVAKAGPLETSYLNSEVRQWEINVEDGQTLAITKARKKRKATKSAPKKYPGLGLVRCGVKLFVRNLDEARHFYINQLGLSLEKEGSFSFTVGGTISVHQINDDNKPHDLGVNTTTMLCLKVSDVSQAYALLQNSGVKVRLPICRRKGCEFFHVCDPSGNLIEVFEAGTNSGEQ
jgi:ADP-ribosylglycohydrolase/catechol 2,3-dioxygenase-like lactoylglutathione lyase family enzyme